MRKELFKSRLLSLAALCGLALAFSSCSSEETVQNGTDNNDNDKNLTTFVTGAEPTSRTSMDYGTGAFYWEAGDKIWVKDDTGTWKQSSNAPTAKTASFKFRVPGKFVAQSSYKVYYPGKNGNQDRVTIPATQTQTAPNTTAHFGASGDCGTATATKVTDKNQFEFRLDHQAAILVFQPYTSNTVLKDCYLTKVEVTSDNDIASTYTLDPATGALTGTGTGKQIVLTTKDKTGTYINGFPLNTTAASVTTNGAYMVIKPGTHTLKVRYWITDIATNVEGTVTKTLSSFNYAKNTYYDMTASLDVKGYDGDHYYMWDAKKQYWDGYEWTKNLPAGQGQPTLESQPASSNYSQNNTEPRSYNQSFPGIGVRNDAVNSCKDIPNVNEMAWYCMKGDPRWDSDELWTAMGHLYKGGMWFLKKSKISDYSTEHAPDGTTDLRTTYQTFNNTPSQTLPEASVAGNYFYLPTLGYYTSGALAFIGNMGYYWSSSASNDNWTHRIYAYSLYFDSNNIYMTGYIRNNGFRVQAFE